MSTFDTRSLPDSAGEFRQIAKSGKTKTSLGEQAGRTVTWTVMFILLFLSVIPLLVVVKTAILDPVKYFGEVEKIIPSEVTIYNFKRLVGLVPESERQAKGISVAEFSYFTALKNSVIFTFASLFGQVFFSSLAAYAFARLRFPGKKFLFGIFLTALMIPGVVLFIPNYILMKELHWLNTYQGQIAPFFLMSPFAVFFMRQFFLSFPKELEESARLDGASHFTVFRKIVLPSSKGPLATLSILSFINLWNEFFWPFLITNTASNGAKRPLTVALQAFKAQQPQGGYDWTGLMAGTTLTIIPVVLLVAFLGKRVVESLAFSGLKG
jgi:multiple sugar transport system permease protein